MSFPKERGCEGGAYQGNVLADVASGDGLERVAVVADRYEQEGWMVSRYVDVNGRGVRWFIATQEEASLRGQFTQGEAIFDVRVGGCIATHQVRDVDVAIEQFPR